MIREVTMAFQDALDRFPYVGNEGNSAAEFFESRAKRKSICRFGSQVAVAQAAADAEAAHAARRAKNDAARAESTTVLVRDPNLSLF